MEQERINEEKENLKERLLPLLGSLKEKVSFVDISSTHDNMIYLRIQTDKGSYISKKYLSYESNGDSNVLRDKISKNPAGFEFQLLDLYSREGANVPKPLIKFQVENTLVMEDIGEDTLEKRLRNTNAKTAVPLLNRVMEELLNLHIAAKNCQSLLLRKMPSRIFKLSDYERRAIGYYRELNATEEQIIEDRIPKQPMQKEKEFIDLFRIVTENLYQNAQLVHGDMTTYHAVFKNENGKERTCFIDLGSPKFLPVTFDAAELIFSPGWEAPIEKRLEPFRRYVEKDKLKHTKVFGLGWVEKKVFLEGDKKVINSGLFESLRCSAKSRVKRIRNKKEFEEYSAKHPDYASAVPHYRKISDDLIKYLIENSSEFELRKERVKELERLRPRLNHLISLAEPKPTHITEEARAVAE